LSNKWFLRIGIAACFLAFFVIVLGAYVRLSDAGLGCPDWPGCYGQITAPDEAHEIASALNVFPAHNIEPAKAWKEMVHRYFASLLGLFILALAFFAWRHRDTPGQQVKLPFILVGLVVFQGMLGMWTVTQLVRPTIVTLHLLTGLLTLSLLFWVTLKHIKPWSDRVKAVDVSGFIKPLAKLALLVLALQIFLGGWTSTNYVALYCPDFPTCQGVWLPDTHFSEAFVFFKDPNVNYEGGSLSLEAGITVHFLHRVGALITALLLTTLALFMLFKSRNTLLKTLSKFLLFILTLQVSLGIANVVLVLPIPIAVSHNAIAAVLLLTLILINYVLSNSAQVTPSSRGSS